MIKPESKDNKAKEQKKVEVINEKKPELIDFKGDTSSRISLCINSRNFINLFESLTFSYPNFFTHFSNLVPNALGV